MTDHLSLNGDNKITPTTSLNSLTRACQIEREKAARRKFVRQLASHLSMVFTLTLKSKRWLLRFVAAAVLETILKR